MDKSHSTISTTRIRFIGLMKNGELFEGDTSIRCGRNKRNLSRCGFGTTTTSQIRRAAKATAKPLTIASMRSACRVQHVDPGSRKHIELEVMRAGASASPVTTHFSVFVAAFACVSRYHSNCARQAVPRTQRSLIFQKSRACEMSAWESRMSPSRGARILFECLARNLLARAAPH